jgi:NAD(P)-dependent dehydrogenase (short-subunit alcohol dehydrogenase family)
MKITGVGTDSEPGPCIINIAAPRPLPSNPFCQCHAIYQAGLAVLSRDIAGACQNSNLRVNTIAPGCIKLAHECNAPECKQGDAQRSEPEHPPGARVGSPEDVAAAVEFLMRAGFVNGAAIVVDGGAEAIESANSDIGGWSLKG